MRSPTLTAALGVVAVLLSIPAQAQLRTQTVVTGLSQLVAFVADPASPAVFHAVQQDGVVRTIVNGAVSPIPFLDLRGAITSGGERGLLGMAWEPGGQRVFVNFTNLSGHTVVARFRRSAGNPQVADVATRFDLRWPNGNRFITQPFANHNGGHLAFGPDGYLYIGLGDGGSGNDPQNNAQNPNQLLGKMLRIDVNVADGDPTGYRVPPDNPFLDGVPIAALGEIWAFGLRHPWRYGFDDPALGGTGALFIGDVGQGAREEVDYAPAGGGGRNFGWRMREGRIAGSGGGTPAYTPLTDPMLDYDRSVGTVVTGGTVYRGRALGANYYGRYFYADYGAGRLWSVAWQHDPSTGNATVLNQVDHTGEIGSVGPISSFGVDTSGELYLVILSGRVLKLVVNTPAPAAPTNLTAQTSGRTVVLSWSAASGAAQYRIEAGASPGASNLGVFDTGSAQTSFTAVAVPDGTFYVRVRAIGGGVASDQSNEVVVTVGVASCTGPPPAPSGLAFGLSGRTVTLTWSAAGAFTNVVLEVGSSPGAVNVAVFVLAPELRSIVATAPPATYFIRVRARNACGTSAPSNEVTLAVTDPRPPR